MSLPKSPRAAANAVSLVLTQVLGRDRFPVDVEAVARELSQQWCPASPITQIDGHKGLAASKARCSSTRVASIGASNTTRTAGRRGRASRSRTSSVTTRCTVSCGRHSSAASRTCPAKTEIDIERDADAFASTLLMPLDDLRRQVDGQRFDFELVKHCADRYGVSLTAAARQCAEVSEQRVVVAVVHDGALSRSWSSERAYRSGAYLRSKSQVVEVPAASLALIALRRYRRQRLSRRMVSERTRRHAADRAHPGVARSRQHDAAARVAETRPNPHRTRRF